MCCLSMLLVIALFACVPSCLASSLKPSEHLADAVHAISKKCFTHREYNICFNHATTELARCSPDDLNCQRSAVLNTSSFCDELCGVTDFIPSAVTEYMQLNELPKIANRESSAAQGTFSVGGKEFTAAEVVDALALKQFLEAQERSHAPLQMIEEHLKPAVSSIRGSLKKSRPDLVDESGNLQLAQESAHSDPVKRASNEHIRDSFLIHLKDPQTGNYLPLPDSYRLSMPNIASYSDAAAQDRPAVGHKAPDRLRDDSWKLANPDRDNTELGQGARQQQQQQRYREKQDQYQQKYYEHQQNTQYLEYPEHQQPRSQLGDNLLPGNEIVTLYQDVFMPVPTDAGKYIQANRPDIARQRGKKVKSLLNLHAVRGSSNSFTHGEAVIATSSSSQFVGRLNATSASAAQSVRSRSTSVSASKNLVMEGTLSSSNPPVNSAPRAERSLHSAVVPLCLLALVFTITA